METYTYEQQFVKRVASFLWVSETEQDNYEQHLREWDSLVMAAKLIKKQARKLQSDSVASLLARVVLAADAGHRSGRMLRPGLDRCLYCGTSALTHDPKCPVVADTSFK
jgi:hypothetical protein